MSPSTPLVSVAVSTYQRRQRVCRLLTELRKQTLPAERFEVVVYDDGSADGTAEAIGALAVESPFRVRLVAGESNLGPATGRNRAWRNGSAPIVAFTDDDCVPSPDWLAAGLEAFADPAVGVVVGRVEPAPDQLDRLGPFARTLRVGDARFFATANCFYRKEALEAAEGFDERFRMAAGEDTDLGLRVVNLGLVKAFAADAVVFHDVRPSDLRSAADEAWSKWIDLALVVRKHPEIRRTLLYRRVFWKKSHALLLLAGAGLLAAHRQRILLLALAPYLRHRLVSEPLAHGTESVTTLPGAVLIDGLEVATMARSSWRHRRLIL